MSVFSFLSKVEDAFAITGRGVVLIPGIPQEGGRSVKVGDALEIRQPDGRRIITRVAGIEMGSRIRSAPILLPRDLQKDDVPVGSELWHSPG